MALNNHRGEAQHPRTHTPHMDPSSPSHASRKHEGTNAHSSVSWPLQPAGEITSILSSYEPCTTGSIAVLNRTPSCSLSISSVLRKHIPCVTSTMFHTETSTLKITPAGNPSSKNFSEWKRVRLTYVPLASIHPLPPVHSPGRSVEAVLPGAIPN